MVRVIILDVLKNTCTKCTVSLSAYSDLNQIVVIIDLSRYLHSEAIVLLSCDSLTKDEWHGCYFFAVLWPQSLSHHDEIVSAIDDRFSVLHSVDLEVDGPEELRLLARQIYSVQREFSWYTRECVAEKLSTDGTNMRIVVFEVPNPSYDRNINLEEPVAIEVRDFKAQIRNEYDGERIMHASDNYRHNQELMKVFERSPIPNSGEVVDHSAYRKLSTEIRSS